MAHLRTITIKMKEEREIKYKKIAAIASFSPENILNTGIILNHSSQPTRDIQPDGLLHLKSVQTDIPK